MDTCYSIKKCWQGEETPGVIPCRHGQRVIVVHRCQPRRFFGKNLVTTTCDYFHASCKIKKKIRKDMKISVAFQTKTYEAYGNIRVKPNQPSNYLNIGHKSKINIFGQYQTQTGLATSLVPKTTST